MTPGKLETSVVWPHSNDKKSSPKGESKIPKLLTSSTPKARLQLISSFLTMDPPVSVNETDHNKVNELKMKMGKCETIQEMLSLIKVFMSEFSMQSSESSTNSGNFNGSVLNSTETTVFDRSMEMTVFNVLHRPQDSPIIAKTPPKGKSPVKSRTSPSTPTGSTVRLDPKRIRRNLSVDSVNAVNGSKLTSPARTTAKRMVDKATVMDVEPIVFPEVKSIGTQTEGEVKEEKEVKAAPIPPPPPMMMAPPPPPMPGPPLKALGEKSPQFIKIFINVY